MDCAEAASEQVGELEGFRDQIKSAGFSDLVLLGMGGAILAGRSLAGTFGKVGEWPRLHVVDSTAPQALSALEATLNWPHALFIVASKSGTTLETLSLYRHYFDRLRCIVKGVPGQQFIAITNRGTPLEQVARQQEFRRSFLVPAEVGGRYSALTHFALLPAALMGVDIGTLLDRAIRIAHGSAGCVRTEHNAAVGLGAFLAVMQRLARDKVSFIISPDIAELGLWLEQMIAESTAGEGVGMIPVIGEPLDQSEVYGNDRFFVYLRARWEPLPEQDRLAEQLEAAGVPLVRINLSDRLDLGDEFMRWQIATAVAASAIGVDAFEEPAIDQSKANTVRLLAEFQRTSNLTEVPPTASQEGILVFGEMRAGSDVPESVESYLRRFFELSEAWDYIALQAYLAPDPSIEREISEIRRQIRNRTGLATTFGYGPAFLHSTGQLHRAGPHKGVFICITNEEARQILIPDQVYGFETLIRAQYLGDLEALRTLKRRVVRIHLIGSASQRLRELRGLVERALA